MRKIAANYVFLPGYPLLRLGYIVWEEGGIKDVVDTGGKLHEICGMEFYGGMIVSAVVYEKCDLWEKGQPLLSFLSGAYGNLYTKETGLAIIEGADWERMVFQKGTVIRRLI